MILLHKNHMTGKISQSFNMVKDYVCLPPPVMLGLGVFCLSVVTMHIWPFGVGAVLHLIRTKWMMMKLKQFPIFNPTHVFSSFWDNLQVISQGMMMDLFVRNMESIFVELL